MKNLPGLLLVYDGLDDHGGGVDPGQGHEQGEGPRDGNDVIVIVIVIMFISGAK